MAKPPQPAYAAVTAMLRTLDPPLRLTRCWEMLGGVSAAITSIEAERPGGERELLVLRQYGSVDVAANGHIATTEYQLLASMGRSGVPVPRPLQADESGTIVPGPCLLVEFAQGSPLTGPPAPPDFAGQLGALLARVHGSGIAPSGENPSPPRLPAERAGHQGGIGRELASGSGQPVGRAARGLLARQHPVAGGADAQEALTRRYRALRPDLDVSALPHWDLYAALRPAGTMADLGLPPAELAHFQAGHAEFVRSALRRL